VLQEGAFSRMMRALSDAPSVRVEDVTEEIAMSRTFVTAPEVVLGHFACRMLEEAEQHGRYGVGDGNGSGDAFGSMGWTLDSDGTTVLVQKVVLLLKMVQTEL